MNPRCKEGPLGTLQVFDPLRSKYVTLTPEEKVRQDFIHLLMEHYEYPSSLMANEYAIRVGRLERRCDTIVFDTSLSPLMVVEYKAPHVELSQKVVNQAFQYNSILGVRCIIITNGKSLVVYRIGYDGEKTTLLKDIPTYNELISIK